MTQHRLPAPGLVAAAHPTPTHTEASVALDSSPDIAPATGKLGILLPGMGAVGTTVIAGVMAIRKGLAPPVGSLTQMGAIRIGDRADGNSPAIKDYVPLAGLDDLVFGGWDVYPDDAYVAASRAGVLDKHLLEQLGEELRAIQPMKAVFEQTYVKNLHGDNVKTETSKWDQAQALVEDIHRFSEENGCDRLVGVWCGSTEVYREPTDVHQSLEAFEQGLRDSHPDIAPSQIYAWAFLSQGVPMANCAPNLSLYSPSLAEPAAPHPIP